MSYRQCIFAFPTGSWDRAGVLALARAAADDLQGQVDLPAIYARVNDATWAEACGAWLLMFATTRAGDRVLNREYFLDYWSGTYSVICHDDSNGRYLFRHLHPTEGFSIGSEYTEDGLVLRGDVDRVTLRPEQNAVALGIAKVYGRSLRYLDLLYTKTAWQIFDPDHGVVEPREVEAPAALRNYVESWPGDELARRTAWSDTDDAADLAERGRRLIEDDPGKAVELLDRALRLAPDDLVARYNRACAHARRRDRDGMLADLRAVLEVQPSDADDAAADEDLARYHTDPLFLALVAEARARTGAVNLPPGLRLEVTRDPDNACAVVAAPPNGVVLLRIGYYPHGERILEELARIPPPDAITPEGCAAYGARLAAEVAKHADLTVSVLIAGTTRHGIAGWMCGVGRVWRMDDGEVVLPTPYLVPPPGMELPPYLTGPLIVSAILREGASHAAWFEAKGKTFGVVMTHPLPDAFDDDLAWGIAGTWRRP